MKLACSANLNLHAEDSADMYRIEISPGEETVLRTIEELATAIRNGLVTPRSRIYHSASQKWLPIEFHPHYKKALALPERPKSAPTSTPLPGPVPNFAIKREPPRPPEPPPAPAPAPQPQAAEAPPPRPRPSIPLPAAAENLPFIEVEMPPRMAAPKPEPLPPPAPLPPAPAPAPVVAQQPAAPAPLPEPVPVAPPLPIAPAPKLELAADAFPSLVQPRSYLPPELEHEPVRAQAHTLGRQHGHEQERERDHERERPNPLADLAPPMSLPVASRRASGGRPVLVGAGALAVVVVGYLFMTSSRPSSQIVAESAPAVEHSKPAQKPADDEDLPPEDTDVPGSRPSAITAAPPRSGPASQAWSSSSGATAPLLPTGPARQPAGEAAIVSAPDIAPPPANLELAVPKLPEPDSLVPKAQRDTAALKRILKAVGGQ